MKKSIFISVFMLLVCCLQLQFVTAVEAQWIKLPSPESRTYNLKGFDKISLDCPAEVHVRQANDFSVSARSKYKDALDILKLAISNNTLQISAESTLFQSFPEINIYVTLPSLTGMAVNGSGEIDIKGSYSGEIMNVTLNGSGDIDMDDVKLTRAFTGNLNGSGDLKFERLEAANLQLTLQGSGDIECERITIQNNADFTLQGSGTTVARSITCTNFTATLTGSGDYKFGTLNFRDKANVELAGSGDIYIKQVNGGRTLVTALRGSGDIRYATLEVDTFDAELYMSGDIYVTSGTAKNVSASVVGSGDMHFRGLSCNVAHVQLQGSGDITLDVRDELYMERVRGSGEIRYTGNPTLKVKK